MNRRHACRSYQRAKRIVDAIIQAYTAGRKLVDIKTSAKFACEHAGTQEQQLNSH